MIFINGKHTCWLFFLDEINPLVLIKMCTHEVYCLFTEAWHNKCLKGDVNQWMKLAYVEKRTPSTSNRSQTYKKPSD